MLAIFVAIALNAWALTFYVASRQGLPFYAEEKIIAPQTQKFFLAQDILCVTLSETAQKFLSLHKTAIFCEFFNFAFATP